METWSCWITCGNTVVLVGWMDCVWKHCTRRLKYFSLDIFSLLFFGNNSVCRIIVLVWMTGLYAGNCCGFDLCSPCWRDANTASILTPCWIIGQQTIAERNWNVVSNETNKDVRMYIEEFILVDVVTLLYKLELWICIGICSSLYTLATIEEKGWDNSQMYNWHCRVNRITMKWEHVNLWD